MLVLFGRGRGRRPTRLRVGSHVDVARALAPAGDAGLTLGELVASDLARRLPRDVAFATGDAGTVWVCHPFLVHAAQALRGHVRASSRSRRSSPRASSAFDGPPDERPSSARSVARSRSGAGQARRMDARVSFVTLAVRDVSAVPRLLRGRSGGALSSRAPGEVIMFRVAERVVFSLWDRAAFEAETGAPAGEGALPLTLAHNVASREDVGRVLGRTRGRRREVSPAVDRDWGDERLLRRSGRLPLGDRVEPDALGRLVVPETATGPAPRASDGDR